MNDLPIKPIEYYDILKIGKIKPDRDLLYFNKRKLFKLLGMSGEALYELIREATGSRKYQQRKTETNKILDNTDVEKSRTVGLLDELKRKIKTLKKGKDKWIEYDKKDRLVQSIKYLLYERKQLMYDDQMDTSKKIIKDLTIQKEDAKEEKLRYQRKNESIQEEINSYLKREKILEDQEADWVNVLRKDRKSNRDQLTKEITYLMETRKKRNQKINRKSDQLEEVEQEYQQVLTQKITFEKKIEDLRKSVESQESGGYTQKQEEENRKQELRDRELKDIRTSIDKLNKKIKNITQQYKSKENKIKLNDDLLNEKLEEFREINMRIEELKEEKYECMMEENELGVRKQQVGNDIVSYQNHLQGYYGNASILSVIRLIEESKQKGLEGVVGIVAEIIQISSKELSPLFEVLFKNKIFSIIVEKESHVFPLIELNNDLKGGKISIIPLEWYNGDSKDKTSGLNNTSVNMSVNESRVEDIVLFNQCYDIRPEYQEKKYSVNLSFCLNAIFSRGAIVKNIEQAFSIAKSKNLNCVTTNLQVIYSGGYQTKAGYHSKNKMYLSTYNLYSEKIQDLIKIQKEYELIDEKKEEIQSKEQTSTKTIQTYQDQILKLKSEIETFSKGISVE